MDADYLKKTVNEAVSEALAAMAIGVPDDKVEYMGRYLKAYCERKRAQAKLIEEVAAIESKLTQEEIENNIKRKEKQAADDAKAARADSLTDFLMSLESSCATKKEAMDKLCKFTADYMNVPACYIGVKKVINEVETLYYYSANDDIQANKIVGKKLTAPAGEGDDAPQRQGVSFEAFKVPEAPVVEPPEDAPEGWQPPPPPGPQPLVIDNCMRDTRCKFYGIPKLGSFVAVPMIYASSDHTEGIAAGELKVDAPPAEEGAEPAPPAEPKMIWLPQKTVQQSMVLCLDTIGNYRQFQKKDIEIVQMIGEKLVNVFEAIETKQFQAQSAFLDDAKTNAASVAEALAALPGVETETVQKVEADLTPAEGAAPVPDTTKAMTVGLAVIEALQNNISSNLNKNVGELSRHALPAVPAVVNLLYAILLLTGIGAEAKDIYGDITWSNITTKCIPVLTSSMGNAVSAWKAGSNSPGGVSQDLKAKLADTKSFIEANAVLPGEFPAHCSICTALSQWLTKAIGAFDAICAEEAYRISLTKGPEGEVA